jgi:hypothetical protein
MFRHVISIEAHDVKVDGRTCSWFTPHPESRRQSKLLTRTSILNLGLELITIARMGRISAFWQAVQHLDLFNHDKIHDPCHLKPGSWEGSQRRTEDEEEG